MCTIPSTVRCVFQCNISKPIARSKITSLDIFPAASTTLLDPKSCAARRASSVVFGDLRRSSTVFFGDLRPSSPADSGGYWRSSAVFCGSVLSGLRPSSSVFFSSLSVFNGLFRRSFSVFFTCLRRNLTLPARLPTITREFTRASRPSLKSSLDIARLGTCSSNFTRLRPCLPVLPGAFPAWFSSPDLARPFGRARHTLPVSGRARPTLPVFYRAFRPCPFSFLTLSSLPVFRTARPASPGFIHARASRYVFARASHCSSVLTGLGRVRWTLPVLVALSRSSSIVQRFCLSLPVVAQPHPCSVLRVCAGGVRCSKAL